MTSASFFRDREHLKNIPGDKPGYYKWWARRSELDQILAALHTDFTTVQPYLERSEEFYCIYVGIAVRESLRSRINWHVNDRHSENRVRNGTLSTLRRSIAAIVGRDLCDKAATNEFIDKLCVSWTTPVAAEIKSAEAKEMIEALEKRLMREHLYVLNIRDNRHSAAPELIRALKAVRKQRRTA